MQRMAEPVMPLMSWGSLTEAFRQSEAPSDSAMAGGEPKARKSAAKPKPSDVNDALRLMRLSLFLGEGRLRPRFCATGRSPREGTGTIDGTCGAGSRGSFSPRPERCPVGELSKRAAQCQAH